MADAATGKILSTSHAEGDVETAALRFNADGSTVAVLANSTTDRDGGSVQIFDAATGKLIRSIPHRASQCEISPNGRWLFCNNSESYSLEVWDLSSGSRVQEVPESVGTLAQSPDGATIAVNHKGKTSIWRVREK